ARRHDDDREDNRDAAVRSGARRGVHRDRFRFLAFGVALIAQRWDPEIIRTKEPWHIRGELALSCNCEVFCPCVLSLGKSAPTEGYCQTWAGVRIDQGHFGDVDLSGMKFGFMADIPGRLG